MLTIIEKEWYEMKNRIIGIIHAVLSAAAFAGINTVFHACRGEMQMPCGYSVKGADLILILLFAVSIARLVTADKRSGIAFDIITSVGALELIFIKWIGHCQMTSMHCNTATFPFLTVISLFVIAFSAASLIITALSYGRDRDAER